VGKVSISLYNTSIGRFLRIILRLIEIQNIYLYTLWDEILKVFKNLKTQNISSKAEQTNFLNGNNTSKQHQTIRFSRLFG
jgi:hypothetical protein